MDVQELERRHERIREAVRAADLDAVVVAGGQVGLGHVEHQQHVVARRTPVALQPRQQPADRGGTVAPPAVGHGADHVVAVDDDQPIAHHRR